MTTTEALRAIAAKNGGVLLPEKVVDAARAKGHPLHGSFEWDDSVAGELYRIYQARNIIRVNVEVIGPKEEETEARVWVSLTPDRQEAGGGYREVVSVLSDKEMRAQMLADALAEMRTFEVKYARIKELAAVFAAMRKARRMLTE